MLFDAQRFKDGQYASVGFASVCLLDSFCHSSFILKCCLYLNSFVQSSVLLQVQCASPKSNCLALPCVFKPLWAFPPGPDCLFVTREQLKGISLEVPRVWPCLFLEYWVFPCLLPLLVSLVSWCPPISWLKWLWPRTSLCVSARWILKSLYLIKSLIIQFSLVLFPKK